MPNKLLRKKQFEDVIKALWRKSKEKFVSNVRFEPTNRSLHQTINGVEQEIVTGLVRVWKDLEHVEEYQFANLLDLSKRIEGGHYNSTGGITQNPIWSTVLMPVKANTNYTMLRKDNRGEASRNIVFFNQDGSMVHYYLSPNAPSNGAYHYYTFTTTQDTAYLGISVPHTVTGSGLSCMIVEGHSYATYSGNQIPYADGGNIQIGSLISHGFDNSNSNLKSTTVESAIKEVNSRFTTTVKSVNGQLPDGLGNVIVDASQINTVNGGSVENELSELSIRKADKYKPTFISDLTVEDVKITGRPIATIRSGVTTGSAGAKTLAGDKNTTVSQGRKVSKILIGLYGYLEGETVTGVEVYAVKKADDTIVERIVYEGTGVARIPKGETDGILYVDVEVNKSFNDEIYFIARLNPNGNKGLRLGGIHQSGIAFDKTSIDQELQQGTRIPIGNPTTKIPNILIYGETSLSNAIVNATLNNASGIDFTKADGNKITIPISNAGGVTSVEFDGVNTLNVTTNGQLVAHDLSPLLGIKTINGQVGTSGAINLSTNDIANGMEFKVENQTFATLNYMTEQEANNIIAGFTI